MNELNMLSTSWHPYTTYTTFPVAHSIAYVNSMRNFMDIKSERFVYTTKCDNANFE